MTNSRHHLYFIGIGGIGMSALARYFSMNGAIVSGYDRVPTPLTAALEAEGINVHYTDEPGLLPKDIDMAIFTPAVPSDMLEIAEIRRRGITLKKRAEVLEEITKDHAVIAIAGTHGKTTITSMVSHLLTQGGVPITAFIGGIAANFGSNFVHFPNSRFFVVEADEYDKSFLRLKPNIALISSVDSDHLDIYQTHEVLVDHYRQFAMNIKSDGKVVNRVDLEELQLNSSITFGLTDSATHYASDIYIEAGFYKYKWHFPDNEPLEVTLLVPGNHNIENALAASAAALAVGIEPLEIVSALATFKGVARRFDRKVNGPRHYYIDDYAHHPAELAACISAARGLFPGKKITGLFQPHLYSRTRDFLDDFAQSLSLFDALILLDIYPARETPIPGITSKALLDKCEIANKVLLPKEDIAAFLQQHKPEVLISLGAGNIDQLVEPLTKLIAAW